MKRISLFIFFAAAVAMMQGQPRNVVLKGQFENAAGKSVFLFKYSDPLSQREVLVDSATIDSAGSFELSAFVDYPRLMVLQVDDYSQSFYVEAGRTYRMRLEDFDWNIDERTNVHIAPLALPILFDSLPTDELNIAIGRFDSFVDSFIVVNRVYFDQRYRPEGRYFDTMKNAIRKIDFGNKSDFFKRYVTYKLAEIEFELRVSSREKIFDRYVKNEPIRYYDENYMSMVLTLFANTVSHGTKKIRQHSIEEWIAGVEVDAMVDALGVEPLLRNERLRELVVLEALWEAFFDRDHYEKDNVYAMVKHIGDASKFDEHHRLANHICDAFAAVEGSSVTIEGALLRDEQRNQVSLDSLKGKWLYVAFVRVDDANSVGEIETMAHFRDTVYQMGADSVEFVTIVCDREYQKMYHFLNNRRHGGRYNWLWLHFDGNYRFLEKVGVVSYPTFAVFDPEGDCVDTYAPWPASGYLTKGPWVKQKPVEEKHFFLDR